MERRKAVETDRIIREEGIGAPPEEVEQLTIFTQTPQEIVDKTVSMMEPEPAEQPPDEPNNN